MSRNLHETPRTNKCIQQNCSICDQHSKKKSISFLSTNDELTKYKIIYNHPQSNKIFRCRLNKTYRTQCKNKANSFQIDLQLDQNVSKISCVDMEKLQKGTGPETAKAISKRKNKAGRIALPDIKAY